MYAVIRRTRVNAASYDDAIQRAKEGFLPIIRKAPGFLAYYAVQEGDDAIVTISIFEDQAGAEASSRLAADWVRQNLAPLTRGLPEILAVGEIAIHETK